MLAVRLLCRVMRAGVEHESGATLDLGDAEAESLVDRGLAELVLPDPPAAAPEPTPSPPPDPAPAAVEDAAEDTPATDEPRPRRRARR